MPCSPLYDVALMRSSSGGRSAGIKFKLFGRPRCRLGRVQSFLQLSNK